MGKSIREYITEGIEELRLYNIFEGVFGAKSSYNWMHKGAYNYAKAVIDRLLTGGRILIGVGGSQGTADIEDFDREALSKLRDNLNTNPIETNYNQFNDCVTSSDKSIRWQNIGKIDITGKSNKVNEFEIVYQNDFDSIYQGPLIAFLSSAKDGDKFIDGLIVEEVEHVGGQNNSRKLSTTMDSESGANIDPNVDDAKLLIKPKFEDVGKTLSDITLHTNKGDIYLSLKSGKKICFVSCGIKNPNGITKKHLDELTDVSFDEYSKLPANKKKIFGNVGNAICKMFNLSPWILGKVFTNDVSEEEFEAAAEKEYGKDLNIEGNKLKVDITGYVNSNGTLYDLVKDCIGYGYILIHRLDNGKIHYADLRNVDDLTDLIGTGNVESAILAIPKIGTASRIDVFVKMSEYLELQFVIRDKQGKDGYPSHFTCDYKLSEDFQRDRNENIDVTI